MSHTIIATRTTLLQSEKGIRVLSVLYCGNLNADGRLRLTGCAGHISPLKIPERKIKAVA